MQVTSYPRPLAPATVLRYENTAGRFLREQAMADGSFEPSTLLGADVNAYLLRECARVSAGSAKGRVAELRSILRFLYLQNLTSLRLGAAVPPVGGWPQRQARFRRRDNAQPRQSHHRAPRPRCRCLRHDREHDRSRGAHPHDSDPAQSLAWEQRPQQRRHGQQRFLPYRARSVLALSGLLQPSHRTPRQPLGMGQPLSLITCYCRRHSAAQGDQEELVGEACRGRGSI